MYVEGKDSNPTYQMEPRIRLTLQFHVEYPTASIRKQVVIDLDSTSSGSSHAMNPLRAINGFTAAVLQLVDGAQSLSTTEIGLKEQLAESQSQVWSSFTHREFEVAQLVLSGATNQDIANALGISHNTVKFHVKNILEKSHVKNRCELSRALLLYTRSGLGISQ